MEGWLIILAIALLRGGGAWYRRRQKKQQTESSGQGQRRPEPGDPDAFDVDEFDPLETGWVPPWDRRPQPSAPEPPEQQTPEDKPGLLVLDRNRREILERLARATEGMSQAATSMELPIADPDDLVHPHASRGARISHLAKRASRLQDALRSPQGIHEIVLLREVLGPPVAVRGPLRSPGRQPR